MLRTPVVIEALHFYRKILNLRFVHCQVHFIIRLFLCEFQAANEARQTRGYSFLSWLIRIIKRFFFRMQSRELTPGVRHHVRCRNRYYILQ